MFASYHCSRYNTNTGVLTPEMFRTVFAQVRAYLTTHRDQPGDDLLGALVRREYGIENLGNDAGINHQHHALEQNHAGERERWEA